MAEHWPLVVAVLLGAVAGVLARRYVRSGALRRPEEAGLRVPRLLWAPVFGGLAGALVVRCLAGRPVDLAVWSVTALALLVLSLVDADVHRLPDVIVQPLGCLLLAVAVVRALVGHDLALLVTAVAAAIVLYAGYFVLALLPGGGLGYGDVKLMRDMGLALGPLGWGAVGAAVVLGQLSGGLWALYLIVVRRQPRTTRMALGPHLALGCLLALAFAG